MPAGKEDKNVKDILKTLIFHDYKQCLSDDKNVQHQQQTLSLHHQH